MNLLSVLSRRALVRATALAAFAASAFSVHGIAYAQTTDAWQQVRKEGVLRCGAAVSPPYVIRDPKTQTYGGLFPDLCRDFGEKVLKVKVVFVDATWPNLIAGVQSNKWDMALSLSDTPEREKAIRFSAPVINSSVTFAYNKNNPKFKTPPQSVADLDRADITLAVMSGSVADKASTSALTKATIMRLPGSDEARLALLSKRADVLVDDIATNMLVVAAHRDTVVTFSPNPPLAPQPGGFGLNKEIPAADLDVLNRYIEEQTKSGALDRLMKQAVAQTLAEGQ